MLGLGKPVVQRSGKVNAVRPDKGMNFGVNLDLLEQGAILQMTIERAPKAGGKSMTRSSPSSNASARV